MKIRDLYKKWHPEQFSDSIIVDKIECPKDFLSYHIDNLSKSNSHFEFEEFCKKLIERTICPNLIEETGPAAGGDGKVDIENYPVSESLQEKWYFSQNNNNERWAFAISLQKDWKSKCNKDINKIINTKRGYTRIFCISGQAIKNSTRLEYQDQMKESTKIDIVILDRTWVIDKALNPYNLELLSIINVGTVVKEFIIGKNDYAKRKRLEEIERIIAKSNITQETLDLTIESATLSREIELSQDEVLEKYARAKRYASKLKDEFQINNIYYDVAWYSFWWLEDIDMFNENYDLYEINTKNDLNIEETNKLNNLCMLSCNPKIDENLLDNRRKELLRRISILENSDSKCVSLSAKTMKCFINISRKIMIHSQFDELNMILEEAKVYKEYDVISTARCIEQLYGQFFDDEKFNILYDKITELLSIRKKDVEKGDLLYKRAEVLFNNEKYQEAIVYYSQCLTLFYKNETSYKLFLTYCHMGICFKILGMNYGAKNYFIAAVADTITKYVSNKVIEPITDVIIEEIINIELENGQVESALKWIQLRNYVKSIIQQYNLKTYTEEKEIEKDAQMQMLFSALLLQTREDKYEYLASLKDFFDFCQLDTVSLTIDYILGLIDDEYSAKISMSMKEIDDYMESLYKKGVECGINEPIFLNDENISLSTKILGSKSVLNFKNSEKNSLFADLILSYIENCTIGFWNNKIYPRCEIKINLLYIDSEEFFLDYNFDGLNTFEIKVSYERNKIYENQLKIKDFILKFISHYIAVGFMCDDYKKTLSELFADGVVFERSLNHTNCIYNSIKLFGDFYIPKKPYLVKRNGPIFNINPQCTIEKSDDFTNVKKLNSDDNIDFKNISHKNVYSNQLINIPLWDAAKWSGMLFASLPPYKEMYIGIIYENEEAGTKIFDELIRKYGYDDKNGEIMISFIKGINRNKIYDYRVVISGKVNIPKNINADSLATQLSRFHHMNCTNDKNLKMLEDYISKKGLKDIYIIPVFGNGKKIIFDKKIKVKTIRVLNAYELKLSDFEHVVLTPDCQIMIPEGFDTTELDKIMKF